jgi:hypothetical protein
MTSSIAASTGDLDALGALSTFADVGMGSSALASFAFAFAAFAFAFIYRWRHRES